MERIRESFDRQGFMRTLGATLEAVESGKVTITCGFNEGLTQQHGLLHGGVIASLIDVACGYPCEDDRDDDVGADNGALAAGGLNSIVESPSTMSG